MMYSNIGLSFRETLPLSIKLAVACGSFRQISTTLQSILRDRKTGKCYEPVWHPRPFLHRLALNARLPGN